MILDPTNGSIRPYNTIDLLHSSLALPPQDPPDTVFILSVNRVQKGVGILGKTLTGAPPYLLIRRTDVAETIGICFVNIKDLTDVLCQLPEDLFVLPQFLFGPLPLRDIPHDPSKPDRVAQ